jgi:hypothetical protein
LTVRGDARLLAMTRVLFVSSRSPAIAQLARESYERRGGDAAADASADLVVDVDDWGLADPVGICREELLELQAAIDVRVAELPL